MKVFLNYFEKLLKLMGFKKFMWFHVTGFLLFCGIMAVGVVEGIVNWNLDLYDFALMCVELAFVYLCLRVFQHIASKKIEIDSYSAFFGGKYK